MATCPPVIDHGYEGCASRNEGRNGKTPATARRTGRWKSWIVIAIAVALAAGSGWWLFRGPTITVVPVTRGAAAEIIYATGSVEPETWSRSTPLVRGRIIERCRREGKTVKAGDLLARLDDKEALATLDDLRALEEFQHLEFDRQAQLLARGVATSQVYQRAETDSRESGPRTQPWLSGWNTTKS